MENSDTPHHQPLPSLHSSFGDTPFQINSAKIDATIISTKNNNNNLSGPTHDNLSDPQTSTQQQHNYGTATTPSQLKQQPAQHRWRSGSDAVFIAATNNKKKGVVEKVDSNAVNETMALLPLVRCDTVPLQPHSARHFSSSLNSSSSSPSTSTKTITPASSSATIQQPIEMGHNYYNNNQQHQPYLFVTPDYERSSSTSPLFVHSPQPPPTPTSTSGGGLFDGNNNNNNHASRSGVAFQCEENNEQRNPNTSSKKPTRQPQQFFPQTENNSVNPTSTRKPAGSSSTEKSNLSKHNIAAHLLRPTLWLQNSIANTQHLRRSQTNTAACRPLPGPTPLESAPPLPRQRRRPSLTLSLASQQHQEQQQQQQYAPLMHRLPLMRSPSGRASHRRRSSACYGGGGGGAQIDLGFVTVPSAYRLISNISTSATNTYNTTTNTGDHNSSITSPRASTCSAASQVSAITCSSSSDSVEHYSPVTTGPRPPYPAPQLSMIDDNMLTPLPSPNPALLLPIQGDMMIDISMLRLPNVVAPSSSSPFAVPTLANHSDNNNNNNNNILPAPVINIIGTSDSEKPKKRRKSKDQHQPQHQQPPSAGQQTTKHKKKTKSLKKRREPRPPTAGRHTVVQIDPDSSISTTPVTTSTICAGTDLPMLNGSALPGNHVVFSSSSGNTSNQRRSHSITFGTQSVRSISGGDADGVVELAAAAAAAAAFTGTIPTNNHHFLHPPTCLSIPMPAAASHTVSLGNMNAIVAGSPLVRTPTLSSSDSHLVRLKNRQQRLNPFSSSGGFNGTTSSRARIQHAKRYGRLVSKHGQCNTAHVNVRKRNRRFFADIFTTLVDMKWRFTMLLFTTGFFSSWLMFATIYFTIAMRHGDFLPENIANVDWKPCVVQVTSFGTAYLFSVETQHTIGYGHRYMTTDCAEAVIAMGCQAVLGVMIQSLLVGVVFAKLSRPKKRAQTLMFSKYAVICERDGKLCLMFRVADMRRSLLVEAHVRAMVIRRHMTKEGEDIPYCTYDVNVGYDAGTDRIFMPWPQTIVHVIDRTSPFYTLSAASLKYERFEMVVLLEGIVQSTGMTTQARTSYLPSEILWGHRFQKLVTYRKDEGEYKIDYNYFDRTTLIPGHPVCSARELRQAQHVQRALVKRQRQQQQHHDDDLHSVSSATTTTTHHQQLSRTTSSVVTVSPHGEHATTSASTTSADSSSTEASSSESTTPAGSSDEFEADEQQQIIMQDGLKVNDKIN